MNDKFAEIPARIAQTMGIVKEMIAELDSFEAEVVPRIGKTKTSVLIPVELLDNGYTAIETLFMRISQAFENSLDPERWHSALLEKMVLEIPGVRPRVISDGVFGKCRELLRFRHFKRYYFELDYDWRKIEYLILIFRELSPLLKADLDRFKSTVEAALKDD